MDLAMTAPGAASARTIGTADLDWALRAGWEDFTTRRGEILLLPVVYPLVGILAAAFAFNRELFPLLFPLAAGFALVGPVAAAGFYELARRRESGEDASWWHFLDPMKGRARGPLLALTAMLAAIFLLWMWAASLIYALTLGTHGELTPSVFLNDLFTTANGWTMILVGNAVGAVFALLTLAVAAFSFPMVVDKAADPMAAVMTSIGVFQKNPVTVAMWGLRVAVILFLAALPLFIGLMVALPVLGYATWHLYTRAVER
jgi:uncharacterized membrane protein